MRRPAAASGIGWSSTSRRGRRSIPKTPATRGDQPKGATQSRDRFRHGRLWRPLPAAGDKPHHYIFTVYAVRGQAAVCQGSQCVGRGRRLRAAFSRQGQGDPDGELRPLILLLQIGPGERSATVPSLAPVTDGTEQRRARSGCFGGYRGDEAMSALDRRCFIARDATTGRRSPTPILRRSRAVARRRTSPPATRQGGSPPTSQAARWCA